MTITQERTPRPLGLTQSSSQLQNKEPERTNYIQEEYIKEYIHNDFMFNGNRFSLEEFSLYTNIPINKVQQTMIFESSRMGELEEDNTGIQDSLRAIIKQLFIGTLGNRVIAAKQHSILARQQGDTYVPFLTPAVNSAIDNLFKADNQILQTIKALMPTGGIEALEPKAPELTQGGGFTASKAIELIKAEGPKPLIEAPLAIEALEAKYNLQGMPEVRAAHQSGLDTSKEGLAFNDLLDIQLQGTEEGNDEKVPHIDRRAEEEGIDLEQDEI